MSRLTISEAIEHCNEKTDCSECGQQHAQLAEWLKELQRYKDLEEQGRLVRQMHGEWIYEHDTDDPGNGQYTCSVCDAGDVHHKEMYVPYCWKCGASMTAEKGKQND